MSFSRKQRAQKTLNIVHNVEAAIAQKSGQELGALAAGINAQTALGYIGKPEDIASLVSYIASKEAHFITGQSVSSRRHCNWSLNSVETELFLRYLPTGGATLTEQLCEASGGNVARFTKPA